MMVDEAILKKTNEVMIPELRTKPGVLAGKSVELRALPVYYAKQIFHVLQPIQMEIADWVKKYDKTDKAPPLVPDSMDVRLAESLLEACVILGNYYQLGLSKEELDREVGLDELISFVKIQLEVSRDSDFLLRPLQIILKGLDLLLMVRPYQNLQQSELLQSLGG